MSEDIDYTKLSDVGTSELVNEIGKLREATRETVEQTNREYDFPDAYDPNMGLKVGHVTELRLFFPR